MMLLSAVADFPVFPSSLQRRIHPLPTLPHQRGRAYFHATCQTPRRVEPRGSIGFADPVLWSR
jgi:hypothetical protein